MRKDLIEAYRGFYDCEIIAAYQGKGLTHDWKKFTVDWAQEKILADTPKERLAVYLTWNGIIGYTESIYAIATGEI